MPIRGWRPLLAALLLSCGGTKATPDAAVSGPADTAVDAASGDAVTTTPDGPPGALAACLDRPDELPRPPSGQLPCELLPPDFR